jgi:hypothetical protein
MPDRKRERLCLLVGDMSYHRLKQRSRELERRRDQADLREIQRVRVLQDRIDGGNQRLHSVVEEVREADAGKHDIGRPRRLCRKAACSLRNNDRFGSWILQERWQPCSTH